MIYNELSSYLEAKENYTNTPFKIVNGIGYCFVKDEWIPVEEFDLHNSKPTYEVAAKINPDGTCLCAGIIPKKSRR